MLNLDQQATPPPTNQATTVIAVELSKRARHLGMGDKQKKKAAGLIPSVDMDRTQRFMN